MGAGWESVTAPFSFQESRRTNAEFSFLHIIRWAAGAGIPDEGDWFAEFPKRQELEASYFIQDAQRMVVRAHNRFN